MPNYPIRITSEENGQVTAFLPDLPEVSATRDNEDEAVGCLDALLEAAVKERVNGGVPLPEPADICGAPTVAVRSFPI